MSIYCIRLHFFQVFMFLLRYAENEITRGSAGFNATTSAECEKSRLLLLKRAACKSCRSESVKSERDVYYTAHELTQF